MDIGRQADIKELELQPQTKEVKSAMTTIYKEQSNSRLVSARKSLIKATRDNGRSGAGNTRQISEDISKMKGSNMGIGKVSFAFGDMPWKN